MAPKYKVGDVFTYHYKSNDGVALLKVNTYDAYTDTYKVEILHSYNQISPVTLHRSLMERLRSVTMRTTADWALCIMKGEAWPQKI